MQPAWATERLSTHTAVQGPHDIDTTGCRIHCVVDDDVPPVRSTYRKLRLASEWPGEDRNKCIWSRLSS